ncbi:MAG: PIN domain-containing protein [Bryobacteraceae bacterium]
MPAEAPSDLIAVLDACVLWPASLRDTLLRLAETPRQYIPRWSDEIWREVTRNLEVGRKLSPEKTAHLREQVQEHFPDASVTGYQNLIGLMTNERKDRHVLAAAVKCGAQVIVTSNLRDFRRESLSEWGIEAQHPDRFLLNLYELYTVDVVSKLHDQAAAIGRTLAELLRTLQIGVPQFAATIARLHPGSH